MEKVMLNHLYPKEFRASEAMKTLRTNLVFSGASVRAIGITSFGPGAGKSTISLQVALSFAQTGKRVLLIDADMRNPSLHRYLRLKKDHNVGLSTLLNGDLKVGDCLMRLEHGFDIIPGGPIPPNPAELIGSDAMSSLLKVASEHYDYVICDAPPVGVITDAAALSPLCDGVLYVIKQKMANKNQVHAAMQNLHTVNAKILGTVLSQYDISKDAAKGYGHYRSYGYGAE